MLISKKELDMRWSEILEGCTNPKTCRETIKENEEEYGLIPRDLDAMTDEEVNEYVDLLNYLWLREEGQKIITKEQLDMRWSEIIKGSTNHKTCRESIIEDEKEYGLIPRDLDALTEEELNDHLNLINHLWFR